MYLRKSFGPLRKNPIPFVFAWAASFVAFPLAMASIANVFSKYECLWMLLISVCENEKD